MAPPKKWHPVTKRCAACKQQFQATTAYAITKQLYCSRECSLPVVQAGRRVSRVKRKCEQCSKTVRRVPSRIENRDHVFCSWACRDAYRVESGDQAGENNAQWKGGSSTWWKQKARERDDFTCQVDDCDVRDEGRGTHAHHKLPKEAGGDDSLENLITLCDHHHQVMERRFLVRVCGLAPAAVRKALSELYGSGGPVAVG